MNGWTDAQFNGCGCCSDNGNALLIDSSNSTLPRLIKVGILENIEFIYDPIGSKINNYAILSLPLLRSLDSRMLTS